MISLKESNVSAAPTVITSQVARLLVPPNPPPPLPSILNKKNSIMIVLLTLSLLFLKDTTQYHCDLQREFMSLISELFSLYE